MLKVKTKDGTEFVATGGEAKESVAHLNSLIDDHNTIARLYRTAKSIKADTTFLVRQYDGDPCAVGEAVTLKGVRRKRFEFVVSYLRRHPRPPPTRRAARASRRSGSPAAIRTSIPCTGTACGIPISASAPPWSRGAPAHAFPTVADPS